MANSGKPELAVNAYHTALSLAPSFVRARYNLGISCLALGATKEAAEHLLTSLSLRRATDGPSSVRQAEDIWSTLRMAFLMMERGDLAEKCEAHNVDAFRGDLEF